MDQTTRHPQESDSDSLFQPPTLSSFASAFLAPTPNAFASTTRQPYESSLSSLFLGAPRFPGEGEDEREEDHGEHVIPAQLRTDDDGDRFQLYQSLFPPYTQPSNDFSLSHFEQPQRPTGRAPPTPAPQHSRTPSHPSQTLRLLSQPSPDLSSNSNALAPRLPERRPSLAELVPARNFLDPVRAFGEGAAGKLSEEGDGRNEGDLKARREKEEGDEQEQDGEEGLGKAVEGATKLSMTLWEDESTVVYQVQVRDQVVARRADNDHVNCTKMLNACTMTRGKRDAFLKVEKQRVVVKRGTLHLKGVWLPLDRAIALADLHDTTHLFSPLFDKDIRPLLFRPENVERTIALVNAAYQRQIHTSPPPDLPNGFARKEALGVFLNEVATTLEERFPGTLLAQREAAVRGAMGEGEARGAETRRTGPEIPLRRERTVSASASEASSRRSSNPFSESIASSASSSSMSSLSNFSFGTLRATPQNSFGTMGQDWDSQEVEMIDSTFEEASELDDISRPLLESSIRRPIPQRDRRHSYPTQPSSYDPIPLAPTSANMRTRHSVDSTSHVAFPQYSLHAPRPSTFAQQYEPPPSFQPPPLAHQHPLQVSSQQAAYAHRLAPSPHQTYTTTPLPSPEATYSPTSYSSSFYSPPAYDHAPYSPPPSTTPQPFPTPSYAFPETTYDCFTSPEFPYADAAFSSLYATPYVAPSVVDRQDSLIGAMFDVPTERGVKAGERGRERWVSVESEGGAMKKARREGGAGERMRRASVMF